MEKYKVEDITIPKVGRQRNDPVLGHYLPELNLYIVGSYKVKYGGLDCIESWVEQHERISEFLEKGSVICEGIRASQSFNNMREFLKPRMDNGLEVHQVLLNTSLEQMLQSSIDRTGRTEPFTETQIKNRRGTFNSVRKQAETWPEWDSRCNVIYADRNQCADYVNALAEKMYNEVTNG
jgi:hypothetical protein